MQAMNCGAVGIAAHDLATGVEFLRHLHRTEGFPWVSMNLVERQSKQPVFDPCRLFELEGLSVAVLGLTDETIRLAPEEQEQYLLLPWQETLPALLEQVREQADILLLLSSYPIAKNREVLSSTQDIHILLASGHAVTTTAPFVIENTLLAQTSNQGKYLGVLHIQWTDAKQWQVQPGFTNRFVALGTSLPEDPKVRDLVEKSKQAARALR
jgi:2',3'-cyclic-nucleotide 2'-phosphodiesterase (5'-nucleotidase family)